jgi:hypothetical protein
VIAPAPEIRGGARGAWAGLVLGPGAWALNTQLGYALTSWICAHHVDLVPWLAAGCALVALAGALVSLRVWRDGGRQASSRFIAAMSAAIATLFTLAILVQGAAGLFLHGCER